MLAVSAAKTVNMEKKVPRKCTLRFEFDKATRNKQPSSVEVHDWIDSVFGIVSEQIHTAYYDLDEYCFYVKLLEPVQLDKILIKHGTSAPFRHRDSTIVGVSMVGLTLWLKTEPGFNEWVNDLSIEEFFSGLYVLLAGGLVIMLVAFLGCCGALMENRVLLYAFMGTQALGFVLGLAGSAVLLDFSTINSRIEPLIRQAMRNLIASSNNPRAASTLHMIQENVGCCGADGPSDYMSLKQPLSGSCRDTVTGNVYFYGCVDELTWFLQDKAAWICALAMLVCFINVLNCALTLTLIQALKKEEDDALKR